MQFKSLEDKDMMRIAIETMLEEVWQYWDAKARARLSQDYEDFELMYRRTWVLIELQSVLCMDDEMEERLHIVARAYRKLADRKEYRHMKPELAVKLGDWIFEETSNEDPVKCYVLFPDEPVVLANFTNW